MLRSIDNKSVIITGGDTRTINLKRSVKIKILRDGTEFPESALRPGDQVSIEATQDDEGFYTAVNVTLEKTGSPEDRAKAGRRIESSVSESSNDDSGGRPKIRRKDPAGDDEPPVMRRAGSDPKDARSEVAADDTLKPQNKDDLSVPTNDKADVEAARNQVERIVLPGATDAPPSDESDPGRPRMQRGARPARVPVETVERASSEPRPSVMRSEPREAEVPRATLDPKIEKARHVVETFTDSLPNYVCKEHIARFISTTRKADWQAQDIVGTDLVYVDHKEKYGNLTVNGKPWKKSMEQMQGSWSTGEFGTIVADLFAPETQTAFRARGSSRVGAHDADKFDFEVTQDNSHWKIMVPSQAVLPAYRGSVWIDRSTSQILRIEMATYRMPVEFPMDKVESAVDFDFIRIAERQFLLPTHAETLACYRGTDNCTRNVIDFRNYHRFTGDSTIVFND